MKLTVTNKDGEVLLEQEVASIPEACGVVVEKFKDFTEILVVVQDGEEAYVCKPMRLPPKVMNQIIDEVKQEITRIQRNN